MSERESAIEELLEQAQYDACSPGEQVRVDDARSQLAALRQELGDARMMFRAATAKPYPLIGRIGDSRGLAARWVVLGIYLRDDGTGLPLLTDAARDALRREQA